MDIAIGTNKNRTYRKFAEYCLFYTFDDITDLDYSHISLDVYAPIRNYIQGVLDRKNLKWKDEIIVNSFLNNGFGKDYFNARQIAQNKLNSNYSQFQFMSEKEYNFLFPILNFDKSYLELKSWWNDLNLQYREQRKKYKKDNKKQLTDIRYTFNRTKNHSVINYQTPQDRLHICEKPLDMIEDIIKTSSNEGDVVLDCFMGSGTTALATKKNKRNFIGFENKEKYIDISNKRLEE